MKLAIELGPPDDEWETHIAYALEAERLGIDFAWSPELWGYDAVTPLAYLAAINRLRSLNNRDKLVTQHAAV